MGKPRKVTNPERLSTSASKGRRQDQAGRDPSQASDSGPWKGQREAKAASDAQHKTRRHRPFEACEFQPQQIASRLAERKHEP